MAAYCDPYRELEHYLQKAQDEIGIAVKELEEHEQTTLNNGFSDWPDILPPPTAFQTTDENKIQKYASKRPNLSNVNSCFNNMEVQPPSLQNRNGDYLVKLPAKYSPSTRKRMWKMHPSLSFPGTSKDLTILEPNSYPYDRKPSQNGCLYFEPRSMKHLERNFRPRSNSAPRCTSHFAKNEYNFPLPPSGDVNLLSIWADNLVLELDKTLSYELNSSASFSPSSDYSLSPTKRDEPTTSLTNFKISKEEKSDSNSSSPGRITKTKSMSPDSGIEQTDCNTPEFLEETADNASVKAIQNGTTLFKTFTVVDSAKPVNNGLENGVETANKYLKDKNQSTQTDKMLYIKPMCVKIANSIVDEPEMLEFMETLNSFAVSIPTEDIENAKDEPLMSTVCAIRKNTGENAEGNNISSKIINENLHENPSLETVLDSLRKSNEDFNTIPRHQKTALNDGEKWNTLPRGSYKVAIQRSTVNYVSIDELTAFMRTVGSGPFVSPNCSDVSTDVKDDKRSCDAVTQTTPVPLSRSSSLTFVTECDCSDFEISNGNNTSDMISNCSNCVSKKRHSSSSSSTADNSSDCAAVDQDTSENSSLQLSEYSGSSDSFEFPGEDEASKCVDESYYNKNSHNDGSELGSSSTISDFNGNQWPHRSSESTLRGSTLGDISEEHFSSENISIKSNISMPVFSQTHTFESQASASFPSSLKLRRRNHGPDQPIEPKVLIVNESPSMSNSAPILRQKKFPLTFKAATESSSSDSSPTSGSRPLVTNAVDIERLPTRAQSANNINELQAIDACHWLRAAGFPQYAQMYEENQFPLDLRLVQRDHRFLSKESIQALYRRLTTLNRVAKGKYSEHENQKKFHDDDSDETDETFALSTNWEFERSSRRWSRILSAGDITISHIEQTAGSGLVAAPLTLGRQYLSPEEAYCSSYDSVLIEDHQTSQEIYIRTAALRKEKPNIASAGHIADCSPGSSSGSGGTVSLISEDIQDRGRALLRSGSDRLKKGARSFLKKMDSFKGRKIKKKDYDDERENNNMVSKNTFKTEESSSSSLTSSPQLLRKNVGIHSSIFIRKVSCGTTWTMKNKFSECVSEKEINSANATNIKSPPVKITCPDDSTDNIENECKEQFDKKNLLHPYSSATLDSRTRGSYYDNVAIAPLVAFNELYDTDFQAEPNKALDQQNNSNLDREIIIISNDRRDSGVGSSLTRGLSYNQAPWHCFSEDPDYTTKNQPPVQFLHVLELTASQMLQLKKLCLLKVTTVMETFTPTNKSGWNWSVTKFMSRILTPDYKDKVIFGVPLLMNFEKTGLALPQPIHAAFKYLLNTSVDSIGLFRKPGVKSRILNLKQHIENNPECFGYEDQQSYDVADMLKLYFRELPEVLLTNKLSETFISIFLYVPGDLRFEAIQATLILLPDENREVLHCLLQFLSEISHHSDINQMNATNLAVCFAPSLFNLCSGKNNSPSPRRRKTVGVPDIKELAETKAAYECLACLIVNFKEFFRISDNLLEQCRISSVAQVQPLTLEAYSFLTFNNHPGWKGMVDSCIQLTLKESKEKMKGWKCVSQINSIDIACRKIPDDRLLKLWKVTTDIEAPPVEVLNRLLKDRSTWDECFGKYYSITALDDCNEVCHYSIVKPYPLPLLDFCVLRSWKTDLPKGACVLIESSVDHETATVERGGIRVLVLVSRYLIEPCGSGKSRVSYISRVDMRGKSLDWYNHVYGYLCAQSLQKLKQSFIHTHAAGPETKV